MFPGGLLSWWSGTFGGLCGWYSGLVIGCWWCSGLVGTVFCYRLLVVQWFGGRLLVVQWFGGACLVDHLPLSSLSFAQTHQQCELSCLVEHLPLSVLAFACLCRWHVGVLDLVDLKQFLLMVCMCALLI